MNDEVESGQPMAQATPFLPQINITEYSVETFAESLVKFYKALIKEGVEPSFAERLTVAFCQRP